MSTTLTTCARARCYTRIGGFAKRVWRIGGWVCLDCAECCERCGWHLTQYEDGLRCCRGACA